MAAATQKIIIHADDRTGAAIASAIRNSKKLDNQLKTNTNNMRGMTRQGRAQMAQLGHQMQDVAVQLQMGMNPLMILGQQGSQIASIFGAKGALFGSIVAVASLIGGVFFASVMKGADAAGEYADNLIKAAGGVDKLSLAQKQFVVEDMKKKLKEMEDELVETQKLMLLTDSTFLDFIKGRKFEGGNVGLLARLNAIFTGTESLQQQAEKAKVSIDAMNDSIEETSQLVKAEQALTALQGMPIVPTSDADAANSALLSMDESTKQLADRAKILDHSFELVNINFGKLAGNNIPMAKEEFTSLNLKVKEGAVTFHELEESLAFVAMSMDDVKANSIMSLEDSLVSLIDGTKSVKDAFKDMARSIVNDMIRMTIQRSITAPLFGALFPSAPGGTYTTIQGSPSPTVGGSDVHFEGGGYTGMGARAGGVDGRGGFPAILHPNETVIDHTKGQGMGAPVNVTLNISTGVSQTVRAEITNLLPQITNAAKVAVADARQRGGGFSKALVGS